MKRTRRYERFEPVTVRAAARLAHLSHNGRIPREEISAYFRNLASLDPHAGPAAPERLHRLARRRSTLGSTGAPSQFGMARVRRPDSRVAGIRPEPLHATLLDP